MKDNPLAQIIKPAGECLNNCVIGMACKDGQCKRRLGMKTYTVTINPQPS